MKSSNALLMICLLLPAPVLAQTTVEEAILAFFNDPATTEIALQNAAGRGRHHMFQLCYTIS